MDAALVGLIALGAVVLFLRERFPPDIVAVLVLGSLAVLGLVSPQEAISGFSSPATIAVGAMFVLSAGLRETGAMDNLARLLHKFGRNGPMLLLTTMVMVAAVSGFINNTAAVAVFLPVVLAVARQRQVSASKLLIPLSYASQFGGVCTLMGTSTNLLVNSLAIGAGLASFGMFDFTPIGLLLVGTGILYQLLIGWWLLPNRPPVAAAGDAYALREYLFALTVPAESRIVGRMVQQAGVGAGRDLVLVEVVRAGKRLLAQPALALEAGDQLLLRGRAEALFEYAQLHGLRLEQEAASEASGSDPARTQPVGAAMPGPGGVGLEGDGLQLVEVIVAPLARARGRPLLAIDSAWIGRAAVIALARRDSVLHTGLSTTPLEPGDALLLLVAASDMAALREDPDFIVLSSREHPVERRRRAPLAVAIVLGVVTVAASGWMPVEIIALLGAAAMAIFRCVGIDRLYRHVELRVLVLLAAMLPLGIAMEKSGAAAMLVKGALAVLPHGEPLFALAVIYGLTALLTEIISNNATAVVMTPIALSLAQQLGVQPTPFLVAVAFAASTSFSTPIGYQTNTMVYATGGYAFRDFLRVGVPLNLLFWVVSVWAIPRWFPF